MNAECNRSKPGLLPGRGVKTLNPTVDTETGALSADMRARFVRLTELIEQTGFEALPRDSVKHLEDRLWELRMTGRDGISRAIDVTAQGNAAQACGCAPRRRQENAKHPGTRTGYRP